MSTTKFALPIILTSDGMHPSPLAWFDLFTKLDAAVGFTVCTSGTRPGSPYAAQIIYETDTHLYKFWNGVNSVWELLGGTPLGIISKDNSAATVTNTTIGTEAMIASLTFPSFFKRKYCIHFEGYIKNSTNSTNLQTTIRARWADGASSVTTANTLTDSIFCDPLNLTASPTGIDVKADFEFDTIVQSASANANSTIGFSFINSGSIGSSGSVVGGKVLISVEDVGDWAG